MTTTNGSTIVTVGLAPSYYSITDPSTGTPCILHGLINRGACSRIMFPNNEALGFVLGLANLSYRIHRFDAWNPGTTALNGNWTGWLGQIKTGEIDITPTFFTPNAARLNAFHFLPPIGQSSFGFLFARQYSRIGGDAIVGIFSRDVWLAYLVCQLCLLLMLAAYSMVHDLRRNNELVEWDSSFSKWTSSIGHSVWDVWGSISSQTQPDEYQNLRRGTSRKLALGSLGIMMVFIMSLFTSQLLSMMVSRREIIPFRSTSELAELILNGQFRLAGTHSYEYFGLVNDSRLPAYRLMNKAVEKVPIVETYLGRDTERIANFLTGNPKMVLVATTDILQNLADTYCGLRMVEDQDGSKINFGWLTRKGHHLIRKIEPIIIKEVSTIRRLKDDWLTRYIFDRKMHYLRKQWALPSSQQRDQCVQHADIGDPLQLTNIFAIFAILILGSILGFGYLLTECLTMRLHKSTVHNPTTNHRSATGFPSSSENASHPAPSESTAAIDDCAAANNSNLADPVWVPTRILRKMSVVLTEAAPKMGLSHKRKKGLDHRTNVAHGRRWDTFDAAASYRTEFSYVSENS